MSRSPTREFRLFRFSVSTWGYDGTLRRAMKSPKEVMEKLEAHDFDALIGVIESEWLDAKETPYHLDSPKQKLELAKDVAAMANASGGITVIGFDCEKLPTTAGERICKVCQFPVSLIYPSKYTQVLADMMHRAPHASCLPKPGCTYSDQ